MSIPFPGYKRARSEAEEERLFRAMATVTAAASPTHGLGAKPPGLVNDGNTCFFNSTFQALAATTSLINLLSPVIFPIEEHKDTSTQAQENMSNVDTPAHTTTALATGSDGFKLLPSAIPSLQDLAVEPQYAKLMPVTLTFERCLGRAWRAKDSAVMSSPAYQSLLAANSGTTSANGTGASGTGTKSTASSRRNSIAEHKAPESSLSIGSLLKELAKKYDQYDGYRQQDAHEVLRHLLDSMSMEEKDFIKVLHPPSPDDAKNGKNNKNKPPGYGGEGDEQLIPFADALFGGSLVSVVICESCKNVSHTYEGFLDISLSMREQPQRSRKRDKFKAIASKFKPGRSHSPGSHSGNLSPSMYLEGVHPEPSDTDIQTEDTGHHADGRMTSDLEKSLDLGVAHSKPDEFAPLKKKSSLTSWAGKRRSSRPSTTGSMDSTHHDDSQSSLGLDQSITSLRASAKTSNTSFSISNAIAEDSYAITPPRPTPEQAAYIRRLLNGPNLPPKEDPLERLRQGMSNLSPGEGPNHKPEPHRPRIDGQDTDLMDCLRNFSAVEVLEGDNAFACQKCWQYKTGRIKRKASDRKDPRDVVIQEEEENHEDDAPNPVETTSTNGRAGGNSISFAPATTNEQIPKIAVTTMDAESAVEDGADFTTSPAARTSRMPSVTPVSPRGSDNATLSSALSGYSTSEENSSDDGEPRVTITRPSMPQRRKSTHYVLRRAFKRYMIARAPPVLVFHFKRFRLPSKSSGTYASSFASLKKSDEFISFPDLLDLSPFIAPSRSDYKIAVGPDGIGRASFMDHPAGDFGPELNPMRYKLYAVVVHVGATALSGHYIAYVLVDPGVVLEVNKKQLLGDVAQQHEGESGRPPGIATAGVADANKTKKEDNRVWCYCSDTQIRLAAAEEVMQAKAYMCFYEKCD